MELINNIVCHLLIRLLNPKHLFWFPCNAFSFNVFTLLSKRINIHLAKTISFHLTFSAFMYIYLWWKFYSFPTFKPVRISYFLYPFLSLVLVPILSLPPSLNQTSQNSIIILSSFLKLYINIKYNIGREMNEGGNTRNKCLLSKACLENNIDQYSNKLVQSEHNQLKNEKLFFPPEKWWNESISTVCRIPKWNEKRTTHWRCFYEIQEILFQLTWALAK